MRSAWRSSSPVKRYNRITSLWIISTILHFSIFYKSRRISYLFNIYETKVNLNSELDVTPFNSTKLFREIWNIQSSYQPFKSNAIEDCGKVVRLRTLFKIYLAVYHYLRYLPATNDLPVGLVSRKSYIINGNRKLIINVVILLVI